MTSSGFDPLQLLRPRRQIIGVSAVLLPFDESGSIDWAGFTAHCQRTAAAGLTLAVNMDTGFGNLLTIAQRREVLEATRSVLAGRRFLAGAIVPDAPGATFDRESHLRAIELVQAYGATPVIVQSHGLTALPDTEVVAAYEELGRHCDEFVAFELGPMFAPFGKIYPLDVFRGLMAIRSCSGLKHSSLQRMPEWERLLLRDWIRPDFRIYTGNDLAIDMIIYGSDYLLGLSTFAPDLFAQRDQYWQAGDARFYELNDRLQYLGFLAFRSPIPAYKHAAAMFLKLRGWIAHDETHPLSPRRPNSDRDLLFDAARLLQLVSGDN